EWKCADEISNHVVEEKTYRSADAPSDPGHPANGGMDSRRDGQTVVCNIPPARKMGEGADVRWVGEGSVTFIRGRFATSDPEQQYWLDKKPCYNVTRTMGRGMAFGRPEARNGKDATQGGAPAAGE